MEEKSFDTINVIPLVDVMLVLLTIVLTTSTFIAAGTIPVSLPKASQVQTENLKRLTITIDRHGAIYVNAACVAFHELTVHMREVDRNTPVVIRADRDIRLQVFVDILDLLNGSGFRSVVIQTEKGG